VKTLHHNCTCGKHADSDPPAKDWVLTAVHDRGPSELYRFVVEGRNLNFPPCHPDHRINWSVPRIDDERYDTSGLTEG
jgi:hypothetical protein